MLGILLQTLDETLRWRHSPRVPTTDLTMTFRQLLFALAATAALLPHIVFGAIFGPDDRIRFDEADAASIGNLLTSAGGISCLDGSWGTGFIVDISKYVEEQQDFYIIATTAGVLYDGGGLSRGRCAFIPAVSPGKLMELQEQLSGGTIVEHIDSDDWAFVRVERHTLELEALPIAFGDAYDFPPDIPFNLWAVGFVPDWGTIAMSSGCAPDDKTQYPALWIRNHDLERMVIHDCDLLSAARGGPLVYLTGGKFFAIAINAGDGPGAKHLDLRGIPYDPNRSFHNFARRFDAELEQKLIAFVSRFAHIKDPSPSVRAFSELVRNIQAELTRLGYDAGPIDGLLGSKTRDAIQAFQATLDLTQNGRISEEILLLMRARK